MTSQTKLRLFCTGILILLSAQVSDCEQPLPSLSPTSSVSASDAALTRQIELITQLDQRLLTTVYFCLGTVVTIFALMIGYNWFANFRTYERDKETLHREMQNSLQASANKANEETMKKVSEIESRLLASTRSQVQTELQTLKKELSKLQLENLQGQVGVVDP